MPITGMSTNPILGGNSESCPFVGWKKMISSFFQSPSSKVAVKRRCKFVILVLMLGGSLLSHALAQEKPAITTEIITLSQSGVIRDLFYSNAKGGEGPIKVYSLGFGPPIQYQGDREIIFYHPLKIPTGFEGEKWREVGRVTLPEEASKVMLLFDVASENKKGNEEYRIHAFRNDKERFPPGAYRFFNLSKRPLNGQIGEAKIKIEAQSSQIIQASGDSFGNVELRFFGANNKVIYSSVWAIKERRRSHVFLSRADSKSEKLTVRKIVEPVVPEKEKDGN